MTGIISKKYEEFEGDTFLNALSIVQKDKSKE